MGGCEQEPQNSCEYLSRAVHRQLGVRRDRDKRGSGALLYIPCLYAAGLLIRRGQARVYAHVAGEDHDAEKVIGQRVLHRWLFRGRNVSKDGKVGD